VSDDKCMWKIDMMKDTIKQCQLRTGLIVSVRLRTFKTRGILVLACRGYINVTCPKTIVLVWISSL